MSVLVVGVSHRTAPVSVLEQIALDSEGVQKLVQQVIESEHVLEATALATCNRVEIYAEVDRFHGSVEAVSRLLCERADQRPEDVVPHLYVHYDDGAVSHLFNVASGLDSMVVGEGQILGQARDALRIGQESGTIGPALNVLFQQALRVGKRAHAETDIDRAAPSLVAVAVERASGHVNTVADKRVVVIGAGSMAALAVSTVRRLGAGDIAIANRTDANASRLAEQYDGRAVRLEDINTELSRADIIVSCTGAAGVVLPLAQVAAARSHNNSPLAVIDLALPHDVDPAVAELPGVLLIGLARLAEEINEDESAGERDRRTRHRDAGDHRLPRRPPLVQCHPDRRRLAHDGHRGGRGRGRPPAVAAARPRPADPRRGRAGRAPCGRQAAAPADGPREGARQRGGRDLLRGRARRAVLARPRGRRRGHPRGGSVMTEPLAPLRVGTRASQLARTQSGHVADALRRALDREVVLVEVTTEGDVSSAPLSSLGGVGVFVSALRDALLRGEVDVAVHSLKDIPTYPTDGIELAAVPQREDPRDAVVARDGLTLGELPAGSKVGTGSLRRAAQLKALGLGLEVVDIRGNVDTRIGKVTSGELDAVLLARAGLARLGRLDEVTEVMDPLQMLPAPGQGALALECRSDDELLVRQVRDALDDEHTRAAVTAERIVLATLEAGCSAPVGALAEIAEGEVGDELWVRAIALSYDGGVVVRKSATGTPDDAVGVGQRLAAEMLEEGADTLIQERVS